MKDSTSTPSAEGAPSPPLSARDIIFDMEDDVHTAKDLAKGVIMMLNRPPGHGLDTEEVDATVRAAHLLHACAVRVEAAWTRAFEATVGRQA